MSYNGQSQGQYPPYNGQGVPAYVPQQFHQYAPQQYQNLQPPPSQSQPRIEVVIPSRNPHFPYHPPPPQQQYHQRPPPPRYYQRPPQPVYNYNNQFAHLPYPQPLPPTQQQPRVNGHATMQHPPSSPDPLHNGHHEPPRPRPSSQSAPRQPVEPEPNYAVLLLSLADEYFEAAKKLKSRSEEFYQLIATGLGCIESVLTNFKLEPLREAQISLRYAQILFDETENHDDAEKILTKAIEICERNNFLDLKYSLQLLLSCVLYQSKPKAAIKDLQNLIEDIEAYKHVAWGYAMRYQLILFYLSNHNIRDLSQAILQAESLGQSARGHGDRPMVAFAMIVEALLHLQSSSQDAVASAQRALATARSMLMDAGVASVPQLAFMTELIDLCCSTRESNFEQGDQKRKRMHELFGAVMEDKNWQDEGPTISIPLSQSSLRSLSLQKGGLVQEVRGRHVLQFAWLDLEEAEVTGFLLSAASKARKNASDRDKVQQFLDEGLRCTRELVRTGSQKTQPEHVQKTSRARMFECRYLVEQAFLDCSSGRWSDAQKTMQTLTRSLNNLVDPAPKSIVSIKQYLQGTIEQGQGNLDAAIECYQSPDLSLNQFQRTTANGTTSNAGLSRADSDFDTWRNISTLAAMNTLLIINSPSHPYNRLRAPLIDQLNTLIKSCTDKNILASYTLIHSHITSTKDQQVVPKNQLVSALNAAKAIANTQITALVLMVMQQSFFRGQTDEHANKCVRAAAVNVRQCGDPTWNYVAAGMEVESLDFRGENEEVRRMREEMRRRLENVPGNVKQKVLNG